MCASLLSFLDTNLNYTQIEVILIFTCTYIYIDMYCRRVNLTYLFHICPTYQNMTLSTIEISPSILLHL